MSLKHILLFGDQSVEKLSGIKNLVRHCKTSQAAKRFLAEATDTIQLDLSRLNKHDHGWDKSFDSLLGLAEDYSVASHDNIVVSTVLMCAGRLGQLIVDVEEDPTILGSSSSPVEIVALCGGLLPAAAVLAAKDSNQLFALSKDIISVGLRLAVEVHRRAQLIERTPSSWGKTYTGLPVEKVQKILDEFHTAESIPPFRRIAIGVEAENWLTLIGPPSSLTHLASWSPEISAASSLETDVPGPIHSSLLPKIDTAVIVGTSPLLAQTLDNGKAHMWSPGTCKEYKHSTLGPLLGEIVEDIAHNVLHVTKTIRNCVGRLDPQQKYKLSVMGPTNHLAAMKQSVNTSGITFQLHQPETSASAAEQTARGGSDLIAIVGMSGRFPGSESVDAFWDDLLAGKCQIKEIPKSRFDLDAFYDPTGEKKNSTMARHGCFLDDPGLFDHRLFNISPREAAQMDPTHRLLLTVGYEALQQAGYSPEGSLATGGSRIATYFGQAADEWQEILNQKGADIYYVPGFSRAFGPARLHYQHKWSGPSYALDSACSTSATAVDMACKALIARECDTALAGGGSVLTTPNTFSGLSRAGMLSTTGGCRTFHDDADGYCRAEGAGVVVLKRLEDARLDNDNILAVIRGSARTYSSAASSMTHPSAESQQDTYTKVLRQSGLDGDEIAYVEMHGTGTQAGDFEEMASVSSLSLHRRKDNPLTVGAVKASVGHGEGASAVTSLIKVILMLRERTIPPQPGPPFKLNQKFPPLSALNIKILHKQAPLKPSPRGDKRIKALVNSFDASGGNVSLLVEEAPPTSAKPADVREWHVVALSARSAKSLTQNRVKLLEFLESHPETKLADLAYTTTARRIHEPMRSAYIGSTIGEIMRQLRLDIQGDMGTPKPTRKSKNREQMFLFTGQGSQYAGMGADLYRDHAHFRSTVQEYQKIAASIGLPHFLDLISNRESDMSSQSTTKIQLAIVAVEVAVASLLSTWGITPSLVVGHSLGEYSALCVAGVLSVSDTLLLVGHRAMLMEKHLTPNTHAMLATNATEEALQTLFRDCGLSSCGIACSNAPSVNVASGTLQDIEALQKHMASTQSLKTTILRVPYGFHSSQIEPIMEEYERFTKRAHFAAPQVPVASTLLGKVVKESGVFCPNYLAQQARQKVSFVQALQACRSTGLLDGTSLWFEIGPDPVCLGLARRTLDIPASDLVPTLKSGNNDWRTISHFLKRAYEVGLNVNWTEIHRPFTSTLTLLNLPTYAFDSRDFWTAYKEPEVVVESHSSCDCAAQRPHQSSKPASEAEFSTTTLQRVETEKLEGSTFTAIFSSQASDPKLLGAIKGHGVNGQTICPLAIFQDMALSAASFVFARHQANSKKVTSTEIRSMDMSHAFVLNESTRDAVFYVTSVYRAEDKCANIKFESVAGNTRTVHGTCRVIIVEESPDTWLAGLSQTLFLLNARVDTLRDLAMVDKAYRLTKGIVYQLFSSVVSYGPVYQTLEEVIMDHASCDAIGSVKLSDTSGLGQFNNNPFWMDAVLHLAGFVLNSGLRYPHDIVCLALGFDSWRSITDLIPGETYTSYVCMQEQATGNGHVVTGNCYVFHGNNLVQATLGIKFLKLKRVALNTILGVSEAHQPLLVQQPTTAWTPAVSTLPVAQENQAKFLQDPAEVVVESNKLATGPRENDSERMIQSMLSVIASESGCTVEDMVDDARYTDLGIDSVMAITIFAMVNRNLGIDLPAAFFMENETIGESKAALRMILAIDSESVTDGEDVSSTENGFSTPGTTPETPPEAEKSSDILELQQDSAVQFSTLQETPSASHTTDPVPQSVLEESSSGPTNSKKTQPPPHLAAQIKHYQGARTPETPRIFFLADESGSTFGYINLPNLGAGVAVCGVESPFAGKPGKVADANGLLDLDIQTLAAVYLQAIRKEQPSGPYMLGGISSGAMLAFECARQLMVEGQEVAALFLLDCADLPTTADEAASLPGQPAAPKRRLMKPGQAEHFKNTVSMFRSYKPTALPPGVRMCLYVAAKRTVTGESNGLVWSEIIPGLQTTDMEAERGSFLTNANVGILGSRLKESLVGINI